MARATSDPYVPPHLEVEPGNLEVEPGSYARKLRRKVEPGNYTGGSESIPCYDSDAVPAEAGETAGN